MLRLNSIAICFKARERLGLPESEARVYGLAVAKVVAGRGGGSTGQHASQVKDA